jgi:acetyl-CoA/propionyl-CoA carboxylase biotin carboxyl carrier protein
VNTRLQVEHPVTEEVTGIDLVREQLRIAAGEPLGYADPPVRGHSIEFRINGEDPGRGFLPAPGVVTGWSPPSGPGVRLDAGVERGSVVAGAFDSMLAKLVVTGATRRQALERARRALDEFVVEGMPTVLPFHRAVTRDDAFTSEPFTVHTRWIETEFDNTLPPYDGELAEPAAETERERVVVEVGGRRLEVVLPAGLGTGAGTPARGARPPGRRGGAAKGGPAAGGDALTSPMQGTIVKVVAEEGQRVEPGDLVVVLEAMKMEQPLGAHKAGVVTGLAAEVGAAVGTGAVICRIEDPAG